MVFMRHNLCRISNFCTCQAMWCQNHCSKNGHIHTSNCCTYQLQGILVHQFPNMGNHHLRKVRQSKRAIQFGVLNQRLPKEGAKLEGKTLPLVASIFSGLVSMADPKAFISNSNSTGTPSGAISRKFSCNAGPVAKRCDKGLD